MIRTFRLPTLLFLATLALTLLIWVLRGAGLLGFMPGGVLWVLIFACIVLAVLSNIR